MTSLRVQRIEHIAGRDFRIRLGRPTKSRLLLPCIGGLAVRFIKIVFVAGGGSERTPTGLPFARGLWTTNGVA